MDEYIEREAVVMGILGLTIVDPMVAQYADAVLHQIQQAPAADVAPVRHARWIDAYPDIEPNPMFMYGICSECGFEQGISKYLKYCPDCGAKMDG